MKACIEDFRSDSGKVQITGVNHMTERLTVEQIYPRLQKIAARLASTGLPKTLSADDLTQVAAIAYWEGRAKSFRDCKKYMTNLIRSERLNGTAMNDGIKGRRSTSKKVRRHHMALSPDSLSSLDEKTEAGILARELLRKMPKHVARTAHAVYILGFSGATAARILGVRQKTVSDRLKKMKAQTA